MVDVFHHSFQGGGLPESSLELIPTVNAYSLILWALDGKNQGHGYGFPFDRPHLSFVLDSAKFWAGFQGPSYPFSSSNLNSLSCVESSIQLSTSLRSRE